MNDVSLHCLCTPVLYVLPVSTIMNVRMESHTVECSTICELSCITNIPSLFSTKLGHLAVFVLRSEEKSSGKFYKYMQSK